MTPARKYTIATLSFYGLLAIVIMILGNMDPGGPCVPGLGGMLLLVVPFIAGAGFLFSLIGRLMGEHSFTGPLIINGAICLVFTMLMFGPH